LALGPRFFGGRGPRFGFPLGAFFALVILIAVIALAVVLLRHEHLRHQGVLSGTSSGASAGPHSDALKILRERFARGEIDPEDYKIRRDLLRE
jgi:uncharacterized membrane protein